MSKRKAVLSGGAHFADIEFSPRSVAVGWFLVTDGFPRLVDGPTQGGLTNSEACFLVDSFNSFVVYHVLNGSKFQSWTVGPLMSSMV